MTTKYQEAIDALPCAGIGQEKLVECAMYLNKYQKEIIAALTQAAEQEEEKLW